MFLICNAILAFLAKNSKFSSSFGFNHGEAMKTVEDGLKQITEMSLVLVESAAANEDVMGVVDEEAEQMTQQDEEDDANDENTAGIIISENLDDHDDDDGVVHRKSTMEDVNDASVSTEELNKKFEEFIRKMKEEIRIEFQQPLITV
ncbi:Unknown protein [Striga hermonthica]|uniref:Uncharacterized protein n=1 Tax=Striga hermonthica TaxID=68872 RepID=A0A9N7MYG0_STRHE|nr:Unknown protein [Striga hermonthica]